MLFISQGLFNLLLHPQPRAFQQLMYPHPKGFANFLKKKQNANALG